METEYRTYEYKKQKGMEKQHINFWYRQTDCLLTLELSHMMYQEANKNESIMSIDLVIGGDHGKGAFIASINLNANFTSGRNITTLFF